MASILIVYHTVSGNTAAMAQHIADGVRKSGHEPTIRAIPEVSYETVATSPEIPDEGAPYVSVEDVLACDGMILGSPTHFGSLSASVAQFFEQIGRLWLSGALVDRPAGVFTSTGSMHGGQELVLQQLMVPLLHMGMLIVGVPYTERALNATTTGGTPYGPSHLSRQNGKSRGLDQNEIAICQTLGERVARHAEAIKNNKPTDQS